MSLIIINLMSDALLKIRFLGLMILLCINYILIQILIGMVWTQKEGLEMGFNCVVVYLYLGGSLANRKILWE